MTGFIIYSSLTLLTIGILTMMDNSVHSLQELGKVSKSKFEEFHPHSRVHFAKKMQKTLIMSKD